MDKKWFGLLHNMLEKNPNYETSFISKFGDALVFKSRVRVSLLDKALMRNGKIDMKCFTQNVTLIVTSSLKFDVLSKNCYTRKITKRLCTQ